MNTDSVDIAARYVALSAIGRLLAWAGGFKSTVNVSCTDQAKCMVVVLTSQVYGSCTEYKPSVW